ncbi:MAG: hypothetical protein IV107_09160 [Paucibacter sp.]|nr:hypothetical protein [Roseateles sp.]
MKRLHCTLPFVLVWLVASASTALAAEDTSCTGTALPGAGGKNVKAVKLADGGVAAFSGMNINIDGYGRAYHRRNREAGAVLHLCVGARVWLPDGSSYEGSESTATCTGKFMTDLARIEAAGWTDPSVGAVEWYGVAAEGSVKLAGRTIRGVKPLLQKDGSGFYVSPTSLVDKSVPDLADQHRYPNPLRVPSAVLPRSLAQQGIALGSFGVAIHRTQQKAVPFVVADGGPKVGEGSPALARPVSGLAPSDQIDLKSRFAGQVDRPDVLWVFFGGPALPFEHQKESDVSANAQAAFERWGGMARLAQCLQVVPKP